MEMTVKEFREFTKNNDDNLSLINGRVRSSNFITKCKKCNSTRVEITSSFDYSMGSEYTGIYGEEATTIFKCLKCGNAEAFTDE